ncbi:cytochrome P450 [Agarilytica rhodophyticola]|uniref:cytochrome P450 n=1 Tax=Agarilytica rhodophyticola TaxID=1737490 RepID=UPI000B341F18|nr:cytochrome P450 [Agarilytica rhodophyticola]
MSHLTMKDLATPSEHWFKGSVGAFEPDQIHNYLYELKNALGDIFKISFYGKSVVVLSEPEAVRYILKNRPGLFRRVSRIESVFEDLGVHGVFSAEGEDWKKYRNFLNPAFRPSQIKLFYPSIYLVTQRLCSVVPSQQKSFNFQQLIERYTVDVTTKLSFGYDLNTLEKPVSELQHKLSLIFPGISSRLRSPFPYWEYFKLSKDKKIDEALVLIRDYVAKFIAAAKQRIENNHQASNILDSMLMADPESEHEIFGNMMTLLLAGEDTTANTIAWAIDYLTDFPDIQERIFHEIRQRYPKDGQLKWDDLDDFPLTFAAAQEAMRIRPVTPFAQIENNNDETICGYKIPKGTTFFVLLSDKGMSPELFEEPQKFNPDRWLNIDEEKLKTIAKDMHPFGGGARLCPGRQLALIEMKIALIELLYRFKFTKETHVGSTRDSFSMTVKPQNLFVRATARNICKQETEKEIPTLA